jgi:hypothetical protein
LKIKKHSGRRQVQPLVGRLPHHSQAVEGGRKSELNMSAAIFQVPSESFFQISMYFPCIGIGVPHGPGTVPRFVPMA